MANLDTDPKDSLRDFRIHLLSEDILWQQRPILCIVLLRLLLAPLSKPVFLPRSTLLHSFQRREQIAPRGRVDPTRELEQGIALQSGPEA